jgi:hypothetical protein
MCSTIRPGPPGRQSERSSGFRRIFSREGDIAKKNRFSYSVGMDDGSVLS